MKKKYLVFISLALLFGGGLFLAWRVVSQSREKEIKTVTPIRKTLRKTLSVNGVIDAQEKARLFFATGGKVTYLGAKQGDFVRRGQTLASIDHRSLDKNLAQDLNNYANQRLYWDQFQDDIAEEAGGPEAPIPELRTRRLSQQEQNKLNNSVLTVEIRAIAIQEANLRSPIEGVLVQAPTNLIGVPLTAANYFEIINPASFFLKSVIDETEVGQLKEGMLANIELDAFPGQALTGKIRSIDLAGTTSPSGTVFFAELALLEPSPELTLRLNMNATAEIQLAEVEEALVIPIEATHTREEKTWVEVLLPSGRVEERSITTGLETEEEIEVTAGVSETDRLVLP